MRKITKITLLFVLITATLSMCACHGRKGLDAFVIPEQFDETRHYDISFWAKNDTNLTQVDIYKKAISDFEALYPNITVNMRLYTDYGRIYNDVITNISTNTTPNVCITYPDHIATYMTGANTVVELDDLFVDTRFGLNGSEIKYDAPSFDEIVPQFIDECKIGEHYYAVPFMRSTEALYVNKTYVEAMGYEIPDIMTWDFVWEVSEAAMAKNADGTFKVNGQNVMIPFIYKSTDNMMISMLKQLDAGYSDPDGNIEIFNDTTKDILFEVSKHAGTGSFSTFKISSYPGNFLNAGQCIFAIDSTAGATWMGTHANHHDISLDKVVEFETEVYPIPQFDVNDPKMISQGPSMCIFNKEDPGEVLASWLFMQFMLTNDVQMSYSETEGYVPVTLKAQNCDEYKEYLSLASPDDPDHYDIKIKAAELLLNNTDKTFVTPVFNGSASLRDAAGQLIESVTKSMRRKETVDAAYMDKLFKDTAALYHLNQKSMAGNNGQKQELSRLPGASIALIVTIITVWILLGAYYLYGFISSRKKKK